MPRLRIVPLLAVLCLDVACLGLVGVTSSASANPPDPKPAAESIQLSGTVLTADGDVAAAATVHATFAPANIDEVVTTDDEGAFAITVNCKRESLPGIRFRADSADQQQLGFQVMSPVDDVVATSGIEIRLANVKTGQASVRDPDGEPIANASVAVQLTYPNTLAKMKTDDAGSVSFRYPETTRIESIVAWKDGAGLDYRLYSLARRQRADALAVVPEFPAEEAETLTLAGVKPLSVRVVDDSQNPIEAVRVYPWLLMNESENDRLNLSFFHDFFTEETNAKGEVEFAWMPTWQASVITLWPTADGYVRIRGMYDPTTDDGHLTIQLDRLVSVSGQVTDPEGEPVQGVRVAANGKGYSMDSGSDSATTDESGRYELMVPPEMLYMVIVMDEKWASAPQEGFVVRANEPVQNKGFRLRAATRVFGHLTEEGTGEPIADEQVHVYQYGADLNSLTGVELANPENSRRWIRPLQTYRATTDEKGAFEFMLGSGSFDLRPPRQEKSEKFEITDQMELEMNVTTVLRKEVELKGRVVNDESGDPVDAARIDGVTQSHVGSDWQAQTTDRGTFAVIRHKEPTYVHVQSLDRKLAAIAIVKADQTELEIRLKPTASLRGRLLSPENNEPWPNQQIRYGVDVPSDTGETWSTRFGGSVVTDADGHFEIDGLVGGWDYSANLGTTQDGMYHSLPAFTVKTGEVQEIGDLQAPPRPKRYVPPTLEERIAGAFEIDGTPLQRLERALKSIDLVQQHLLIVFGKPEDPRIHRLMEIRYEDKDFYPVRDEFRFMAIPTDDQRIEAAEALAKRIDESIDEGRHEFLLVLLDANGNKVEVVQADRLCVDGELSKDKFIDWLTGHQTKMPAAQTVLDDALRRAKEEDKRVIVQETATWCGPCHLFSRFLSDNPVWQEDYILVKMDHRLPGARELMKDVRDGAEGGIPWYAILDASGTRLVTSNEPEEGKNIGFPSSETGQKHLAEMLNSTRQRMTEQQVTDLVSKLNKTEAE